MLIVVVVVIFVFCFVSCVLFLPVGRVPWPWFLSTVLVFVVVFLCVCFFCFGIACVCSPDWKCFLWLSFGDGFSSCAMTLTPRCCRGVGYTTVSWLVSLAQ